MPTIVYELTDGSRREVDAPAGTSVMKNAVLNNVPGIVAECGGNMMCATCHVYVSESDAGRLPGPSLDEEEMLEVAAADLRPTSRLACQLVVQDDLEGYTVSVPETQV